MHVTLPLHSLAAKYDSLLVQWQHLTTIYRSEIGQWWMFTDLWQKAAR